MTILIASRRYHGRIQRTGVLSLVLLSSACTHQLPASDSAADDAVQPQSGRNRDIITRAELEDPAIQALSILDAIKSLRPTFLSNRGGNAARMNASNPERGQTHASIDGGRIVLLEELGSIHTGSVYEVLYLNSGAAMQKFGGAAHEGAVIVVKTAM